MDSFEAGCNMARPASQTRSSWLLLGCRGVWGCGSWVGEGEDEAGSGSGGPEEGQI